MLYLKGRNTGQRRASESPADIVIPSLTGTSPETLMMMMMMMIRLILGVSCAQKTLYWLIPRASSSPGPTKLENILNCHSNAASQTQARTQSTTNAPMAASDFLCSRTQTPVSSPNREIFRGPILRYRYLSVQASETDPFIQGKN